MTAFNTISDIVWDYRSLIGQGILNTLILSLIGTAVGFVFALPLAVAASLPKIDADGTINRWIKAPIRAMAKGYIAIFRGTPMIVQAMVIYYGVYEIVNRIAPRHFLIENPLYLGIFIITINTAAYIGEVIRGAIESIDNGQWEAARSLGMRKRTILFSIVLPQAIRQSIPAIGNELVVNIKDSAVLSVIAVKDLFSNVKTISGRTYNYTDTFLIAAVIYFALTFIANKILHYLSKITSADYRAERYSKREGQT